MRRLLPSLLSVGLCLVASRAARADTLSVGPKGTYAAPCAAFAAATDGDIIEIDSRGSYVGDVCGITKNQLTIRGIGGLAKIDAGGQNAQGKAIWVVQGDDTVIESLEFTGAAVPDLNGAGIRQEGNNLTVRRCYFHDNENGILAGDVPESELVIEHSEFDHNGAGDGFSHNLYINHVRKLTFRYNWSHRAVIGHLLKSRAAESYVLYNRITGESDGTSSYELDFPNGGKTYVIGNLIEQGPNTDNPSLLAYIEEGAAATNPSHQLYVVNNTFVNDRKNGGTYLNIAAGAAPAVVTNNVFFGGGTISNQASALLSHNYAEAASCLVDAAAFDYRLAPNTPCVDGGADPGDGDGFALLPSAHYQHPAANSDRSSVGAIDIGAYELGGDTVPEAGTNAGGAAGSTGGKTSSGDSGSAGKGIGGASQTGGANSSHGGASAAPASNADAGCGCRLSKTQHSSSSSGGWLLAALLGLARRRRTRRIRQPPSVANSAESAGDDFAFTRNASGSGSGAPRSIENVPAP